MIRAHYTYDTCTLYLWYVHIILMIRAHYTYDTPKQTPISKDSLLPKYLKYYIKYYIKY